MPCNERNNPMNTVLASLSSLRIEPAIQARDKLIHTTTVNKYRGVIKAHSDDRKPLPFPPITVARLGPSDCSSSPLYVVDGFHRCEAYRLEEVEEIKARIIDVRSMEEAKWLAAQSNLLHGRPLTNKELRTVFRRFIAAKEHLKADPEASPKVVHQRPRRDVMTLGEIASAIGKSKGTIRHWMMEDFKREYTRLYCRDDETGDRPAEQVGGAEMLTRELTEVDRARMSLENVVAEIKKAKGTEEKRAIVESFGWTLAELTRCFGKEFVEDVFSDRFPGGQALFGDKDWMPYYPPTYGF